MVFLCSILVSLILTVSFLSVWRAMPVSWLFDCSDLSPEEKQRPHPHSQAASYTAPKFVLFLLFLTATSIFMKNMALTDVLGFLGLLWLFLQIALADWYYRLIPDQWSAGIVFIGFLRILLESAASVDFGSSIYGFLVSRASGLILCIITALFLHVLPCLFHQTPVLGLGDVKLFLALAIALPPREYFAVMTGAALLGGVTAAGLILTGRTEDGVPYGSVLAAAFLLFSLFRY